jgi:hypothetical protein
MVKTYAHEVFEDSRAILADPSLDPECYVVMYGADPDDLNPDMGKPGQLGEVESGLSAFAEASTSCAPSARGEAQSAAAE